MNDCFEFVSSGSSGLALQGEVYAAADSITNRCILLVDPVRLSEGSIQPKDAIKVFVISQYQRFTAFEGIVSKVSNQGGLVRIESVTIAAVVAVDASPAMTWSNTTALAVLQDIISSSRLNLQYVSAPPSLSDKFLHTWNTDGDSFADEIRQLLAVVDPSLQIVGRLDGSTLIGTRLDVAAATPPIVYPFDEALGETDTDVSRFSLRYCEIGAACIDIDKRFVGTLSVVRHVIAPGQSYTDMILDMAPSPEIEAMLQSPPGDVAEELSPAGEEGGDQ